MLNDSDPLERKNMIHFPYHYDPELNYAMQVDQINDSLEFKKNQNGSKRDIKWRRCRLKKFITLMDDYWMIRVQLYFE